MIDRQSFLDDLGKWKSYLQHYCFEFENTYEYETGGIYSSYQRDVFVSSNK